MKFNKKALARQLDLSAEELEEKGYQDLSDKVDQITEYVVDAEDVPEKLPEIRAALQKISDEADRRDGKTTKKAKKDKRASRKERLAKAKRRAAMLKKMRTRKAGGKAPKDSKALAMKMRALDIRVRKLEKALQD